MKKALLLAIFLLNACAPSSKQPAPIPSSYLRVPMQDKEINLDPSGEWRVENIDVFNVFYDALYLIGPDGEILPGLARSLPEVSDGGKRYRIVLRDTARFHDDPAFPGGKGREATAEDVIYSLKRIEDPKNLTGLSSLIEGRIEELKALGPRELEIRLTAPFGQIVNILAMPSFSIVPREAVKKYGDRFKEHPVGTGPFRLISYKPRQIVAERIPGHWRCATDKQGTLPPGIVFQFFNDPWNAFRDGKLDLFPIATDRLRTYLDEALQIKEALRKEGYGIYGIKEAARRYILFNFRRSLMQNIHLRKAIAFAIPWQEMIDEEDTLSASIIPEPIAGFADLSWTYDLQKAEQELAAAGYPRGEGLPELVFHLKYPSQLFTAGFVQDALKAIGIRVALELSETSELKDNDLGIASWTLDYPDASNILGLFSSRAMPPQGANYGYFQNAAYDALLEKSFALPTEGLKEHYRQMAQWMFDHVAAIPFRQTQIFYGLHPRVEYIHADPLGYFQWAQTTLKPENL